MGDVDDVSVVGEVVVAVVKIISVNMGKTNVTNKIKPA